MKASLFSLLAVLILASCLHASQETGVRPVLGVLQEDYQVGWKLPAGDLSFPFTIQTSEDGKRVLIVYSSEYSVGATILDDKGKRIFNATLATPQVYMPVGVVPTISTLSSDGKILVVANTSYQNGNPEESVLAWYDVDTGNQLRKAILDKGSTVYSLSTSRNTDLTVVSGVLWGNYTFIEAFDSQGRELWKQLFKARELVGYYEFLHVHSNVAVSGDGSHVAAALRDQSVRFGLVCGGRNGVVLFDNAGKLLWNYTVPQCVWNVAISERGRYVLASSDSQLIDLGIDGRVLWSMPLNSAIIATSGAGERFIAGDVGGQLFLGNASRSYWQTDVNGQIESVGISDGGNVSAAVISRDYPDAPTVRLLYVMDDKGSLLANYTFVGATQVTGGSQVAVSGSGCCIVAALETDGVYYLQRNEVSGPTSSTSTTLGDHEMEQLQTLVAVSLVGALGLVTLLFIVKYRFHVKTRGRS